MTQQSPAGPERGEMDGQSTALEKANRLLQKEIEERERMELTLCDALSYQEKLLAVAATAIFTVDLDGRITSANPKFYALTGYSPEEVLGQKYELLKSDSCPEDGGLGDRACREPIFEKQCFLHTRDGRRLVILKNADRLFDTQGQCVGGVESFVDVTALTEARETAERANSTKSEFLANMSHEIRTPMNGILGMTHLALQTELNAEQRDYLQTAESCAHSLLNLINDILDISKIEAGRLEFEAIAFSLRDCLAETLKPHALRAGGKGLELILRVQPEVPDVLVGDPGRLRQVLTNLVGNATKFTERGEIFVDVAAVEQTDGAVVLQFSVHDTGVGIPTEKREAIFDAFVQADSGTTRKYGGTGLGLTISKHLVTMMQGRIWVDSVPGQGSTFHFTVGLPLGAESDLERKAIDPEQLTGMPALIVDDNAVNQKVLAEQLRAWGMLPTVVGSGSDALAALWRDQEQTDRRYRLVLLDAMMPVMDGFEVAGHIRRFKEFAPLAIVMLTSSGLSGESGRSRQLGVSAYLMKPASPSELFDAMLTALSERVCACGDSAPAAEKAAAAQTPAAAKVPSAEHRSLRVLLAEDNPVNQKLALRLLERMGHGARLVQTGREAVEVSGAEPFDLILMDVQMPEMDGLEATRTIRRRESERGGRLPIIAMTAHAMKGDRERCLESGMDDYVAKPIRPEELRRVIETVVRTVGAAAQPSRDLQSQPSGGVGCAMPNPAAEIPEGFDFDKALEVFEGDVELMRETAVIFFQDALLQLARMAEAIEAGDAMTIERSAHSLKGAAGNFSAARVVAISLQMEAAGRGGNLGEAAGLYGLLGKEVERLREAIEARFASRAA